MMMKKFKHFVVVVIYGVLDRWTAGFSASEISERLIVEEDDEGKSYRSTA